MKKVLNFYLNFRLWINFSFLILLFIANCFVSWITYIAFSFLIIMILADSLANGLSYIMFAIPFSSIHPFVSMIFLCSGIAGWIIKFYLIYFIKDKGKISWLELLFIAIFFVYAVMPIGPYSMNMLLKLAIILFIYAIMIALAKKREVFRPILNIRIIASSLILVCLLGLLAFISPYLQSVLAINYSKVGGEYIRYQALFTSPNVLAMFCEILISVLAYRIVKKTELGKERKWIDFILFGVICVAGLTTFSKTYLIALIFVLISLFICMMFKNWKLTLPIAIGIVAVCVITYFIKPSLFNTYISRFIGSIGKESSTDDVMNSFTTGRWKLWQNTITFLGANPLQLFFGRGIGAGPLPPNAYSAHNAYISMIDQLGIVGSILFIIPFVFIIRDILKNKEKKFSKAIFIPIITIAMLFMVEDVIFYIFPV